ncbi:MAG: hypothetical protein LBI87_05810 [Candidatus Accumulibacter sp.]|nr:hypothetical protein [Accumulibacter sp.]
MTGRRNPWLPRATATTRSTSTMFCVGQGFRKGNPERLKARGLGRKRALAPDEFALGIPAMESEPVDPGL